MKSIKFFKIHFIILSISILSATIARSCRSREETVSCFPSTPINVSLNLNLPAYHTLWNTGGWLYINEQSAGSRGLIIVRTGYNTFKIYDRNAPHLCPSENSTLDVFQNIKIFCPEDQSEWILLTGEPTKGAKIPPKTYPYYYEANSSTLTIRY